MITEIQTLAMYEMSLNVRVTWQAHSLSTIGSNGSNRVHPRRQLLADGTETDATSGNIAKHHHAAWSQSILRRLDVLYVPPARCETAAVQERCSITQRISRSPLSASSATVPSAIATAFWSPPKTGMRSMAKRTERA